MTRSTQAATHSAPMKRGHVGIGELARRTGCKVPTVRYYESIGLLQPPSRTEGNQRRYDARDVARLDFIQHCRELGFDQEAIRNLLTLADAPMHDCAPANSVIDAHLADVERRITALSRLRDELAHMRENCTGSTVAECGIFRVLADHSHAHCMADGHEH